MADIAQMDETIAGVGPADDAVEQILRVDEARWVVGLEGGTDVVLEFDGSLDRLTLTTLLGPIVADDRQGVMRTLLAYNALWAKTGGVTLALVGAEGQEAMQILHLDANRLGASSLAAVIANFAAKARVWRNLLAEGPASAPPPPTDGGLWLRA